jgi:hypothetical protein
MYPTGFVAERETPSVWSNRQGGHLLVEMACCGMERYGERQRFRKAQLRERSCSRYAGSRALEEIGG